MRTRAEPVPEVPISRRSGCVSILDYLCRPRLRRKRRHGLAYVQWLPVVTPVSHLVCRCRRLRCDQSSSSSSRLRSGPYFYVCHYSSPTMQAVALALAALSLPHLGPAPVPVLASPIPRPGNRRSIKRRDSRSRWRHVGVPVGPQKPEARRQKHTRRTISSASPGWDGAWFWLMAAHWHWREGKEVPRTVGLR